MLTHDALITHVADRRQAREQAATRARTGRLLRRARATSSDPTHHPEGVGFADSVRAWATGPTGPATTPVPASPVSSPVVAAATASTAGTPRRTPAVAVPRTAAPVGAPAAHDDPAAA